MDSRREASQNKTHTPSILQLIFSILAIILLITGALLFALNGLLQRSNALGSPIASMQWSASMVFVAILVIPSVVYAYRRLTTGIRPDGLLSDKNFNWVRISTLLLITLPFILLLGNVISKNDDLALIFLPPLHVLAVALPVLWLVSMALKGLSTGSSQRAWGIFNVGLVLGPGIILFIELFAAFLILVLSMLYILSQPDLLEEFTYLSQSLSIVSEDPQSIIRIIEPYLTRPSILAIGLLYVAVLVPVIEELLKPIGVWFLSGKKLTPAQGFAAGVLSGAGYALFENLALSSGSSEWVLAVTTRAGTTVVHIFTSAIMGWALVLAWTRRRYITLIVTYIIAVFIHGLWNALALFGMATYQQFPEYIQRFSWVAAIGLIMMIALLFVSLMVFNHRLRQPVFEQADNQNPLDQESEDDFSLVM